MSNTVKNTLFEKWLDITKVMNPKPPVPRTFPDTRFGYATLVLSTVHKNRAALERMVNTPAFRNRMNTEVACYQRRVDEATRRQSSSQVRQPPFVRFCFLMQNANQNYNFWYLVGAFHELLEPISKAIAYVGDTDFRIDYVWGLFGAITGDFRKWINVYPHLCQPSPESFLGTRWKGNGHKVGLYRPVHLFAHLLNIFISDKDANNRVIYDRPRQAEVRSVVMRLVKPTEVDAAMEEISNFVDMRGPFETVYKEMMKKKVGEAPEQKIFSCEVDREYHFYQRTPDPRKYFREVLRDLHFVHLHRMADRIFDIKVSSSSVERINKHFKHCKFHKCLYNSGCDGGDLPDPVALNILPSTLDAPKLRF
ncbi:hypothetical protein AAMO2058_000993700 [Amorphochlora amoebiformis]